MIKSDQRMTSAAKNQSHTEPENAKQAFYETAYPQKREEIQLRSTIGWLYKRLKKYETHRQDTVRSLLPPGGKILDIGCGEGEFLFKILDDFDALYGLDIARTRLFAADREKKTLPKREQKKIEFILSDADAALPFRDRMFDAVTMIATLEHFFDPYAVFAEIRRVLKPEGCVIFQVPNLGFLPRRIAVFMGNIPVTSEDDTGWDGGHLHYFTVSAVEEFLHTTGFLSDRVTCSGVFAPLRQWWVSLLGADIIIRAKKS